MEALVVGAFMAVVREVFKAAIWVFKVADFTVQASLVVDLLTAASSRTIVSSLIAASFPIVAFFGLMRCSSASDFRSGSDFPILIRTIHTVHITPTPVVRIRLISQIQRLRWRGPGNEIDGGLMHLPLMAEED